MGGLVLIWCAAWCAACTAMFLAWGNPIFLGLAIMQGLLFLVNLVIQREAAS